MNALLRYSGYKITQQLWHDELFDIKQYRLVPQKKIEIVNAKVIA